MNHLERVFGPIDNSPGDYRLGDREHQIRHYFSRLERALDPETKVPLWAPGPLARPILGPKVKSEILETILPSYDDAVRDWQMQASRGGKYVEAVDGCDRLVRYLNDGYTDEAEVTFRVAQRLMGMVTADAYFIETKGNIFDQPDVRAVAHLCYATGIDALNVLRGDRHAL